MADLLFVNIDHPIQASNSKARKLVRSHISRRQHEQRRSALELALKLELEKQLQTQDTGDVAGPSRHDSSTSTPSFGSKNASAGSSECNMKAESTAASESVTTFEPGSNFLRTTGTVSSIHDRLNPSSGTSLDNPRTSCPSHTAKSAQLPIDYQQHTAVPLIQQNTDKSSVALKRERDLEEEVEDYAESTSQRTHITTTNPNSRHRSQPVIRKTAKPSQTPRIRYSLIDPSDELQAFARKLGISVPPLLVTSLHHPSHSYFQKHAEAQSTLTRVLAATLLQSRQRRGRNQRSRSRPSPRLHGLPLGHQQPRRSSSVRSSPLLSGRQFPHRPSERLPLESPARAARVRAQEYPHCSGRSAAVRE